jgi:hypothetical protein
MKKAALICVVLLLLLFCSCSVQTTFDLTDFCNRYNSLAGERLLTPESFMSDEEGKLFCFVETGKSEMLVSVDLNGGGATEGMAVSLFADATDKADAERLDLMLRLAVASFFYPDADAADSILSDLGISADGDCFKNKFIKTYYGRYVCSLYSNGLSMTLKIDKIPPDSVK